MGEKRDYILWVALPSGERVQAADIRLETDQRGRHEASGLRYRSDWLVHPERYALNPVHAPLTPEPMEWQTRAISAVLDELLPGRWERAVQQRVWGKAGDVDDLRALLAAPRPTWRVGAVEILKAGVGPPPLVSPVRASDLEALAQEADRIDQHEPPDIQVLRQMQAGSSVGGARPKVLYQAPDGARLAKFTRPNDPFDHARVEAACLRLASRAGIEVPECEVVTAGRAEALSLHRFDVTPAGGRWNLVSANALLKDRKDQSDCLLASYIDLVDLVRKYSSRPEQDLAQLYAQMLFNDAINNRDDHLKNFSFVAGPGAFHLSPAYDLVPSEGLGQYPQLTFDLSPIIPTVGTAKAVEAGRHFCLTPSESSAVNDALGQAFSEIEEVMDEVELSPRDRRFLIARIPPAFRPNDPGKTPAPSLK